MSGSAAVSLPIPHRRRLAEEARRTGENLPGIDLPEIIFVRWQSLVEPQTYNVRINIPQWVREEMLKPERAYCN